MNILNLIGRTAPLFEEDIASKTKQIEDRVSSSSFLVLGGAGSIGQAVVKEIFKRNPTKLHVVDISENNLAELVRDIRSSFGYIKGDFQTFALDIGSSTYDSFIDNDGRFDYVLNLSALKHVRSEKDPYTLMRMIEVNILNTIKTINQAIQKGSKKYLCVSTDKAANPANLYGATKLASDKLFVAANNIAGGHKTRFSITRYGNVVGSRGSVLPVFEEIHANKKNHFPITDERMTRFWITLSDGVYFVLKNFERMFGGEIFVPKIPSIKITDLAKAISPNAKFKIIGIRPGEKLHEAMCIKEECDNTFEYKNFYIIKPAISFIDKRKKQIANITALKEKGKKVKEGFEYNSGLNEKFLSVKEILEYK